MDHYCQPLPSLPLFRRKRLAGLALPMLLLVGCQTIKTKQDASLSSADISIASNSPAKKTSRTTDKTTGKSKLAEVQAPVEVKQEAIDVEKGVEKNVEKEAAVITNLWQRLQQGMTLDVDLTNKRIQSELEWYKNNQYSFDLLAERASPYLYFIIEQAEARGLPLELALLPVVESSFDPFAYSHAGASGLWQLMPATAGEYGLSQNWWYDGRRDVVAATRAAFDYVEMLYSQLGDWKLALAAYNSGLGRVQRALKKNARDKKSTAFWHLDLPDETTAYVPKLLALSAVIKNPKKYGITLPAIDNSPYFETVAIGSQLDMAKASQLAGVSLNDLYKLNPGLNRWSTPPEGPHYLAIPSDKAEQFKAGLEAIPEDQRLAWTRYTVKAGDSLLKIAKQNQTQVSVISEVNQLTSTVIKIGQTLRIPIPGKNAESYTLTANQVTANKQKRQYVVRPGDSFWSISRRYGVSINDLAKWNNLSPTTPLQIDQTLAIWLTSNTPTTLNKVMRKIYYKVRSGDSLSLIADKFDIDISEIKGWNTLNSQYIHPGQQLTLFIDIARASE